MDLDVARAKLLWLKSELENTWLGKPNHPVTRALQGAIKRHNLKKIHFELIIEGMLMDLANTQYATFAELDEYCYRVAGVVGILTATIFGHKNALTLEFAKKLGLAFQLTNILRDVKEDIERKRVYIPAEDLIRFGLKPAEGIDSLNRPAFIEMMQFQIARTENIYRKAIETLPDEDRENQKAGIIMANIYQSLLHKIKKNPAKVLDRRVSLAPLTKLWVAYRTWARR
jgi:phytoene synthase